MLVGVLGINHKSSELTVRELLAKAATCCFSGDKDIAGKLHVVLLATCNRTEIYFSSPDLADAHSTLLAVLRTQLFFPFEHKMYAYFGVECFMHLAQVTAGLDSAILAETEIQHQVKKAYENSCLSYRLPSCLHFMFQKSLKIAKWLRSSFLPAFQGIGLEEMIVQVASEILDDVQEGSILFIGNSEINRKILSFFKSHKIKRLTLCTRALHSAQDLSKEYQLELIDWSRLNGWGEFDLVITGTNQHNYLITPQQMLEGSLLRTRLLIDLSVPRNIDPLFSRHPRIHLFNLEDLTLLLEKKRGSSLQLQDLRRMIRGAVEKQVFLFLQKQEPALIFSHKKDPLHH